MKLHMVITFIAVLLLAVLVYRLTIGLDAWLASFGHLTQ